MAPWAPWAPLSPRRTLACTGPGRAAALGAKMVKFERFSGRISACNVHISSS